MILGYSYGLLGSLWTLSCLSSAFVVTPSRPLTPHMATSSVSVDNWRVLTDDFHADERPDWKPAVRERYRSLHAQLANTTDTYMQQALSQALDALQQAYRLYGPDNVLASFNGGKDAVVILQLFLAVHALQDTTTHRPRVLYFAKDDEFPAIVELVKQTAREADLDLIVLETGIREGLSQLIETQSSSPMAIVLGTRQTDPNALQQGVFSPSSSYMPPFLRVNPILDWSYGMVWHVLRHFQWTYCRLYDQGYTSLGSVHDTQPCPALERSDGSYWPAYLLQDWSLERAGRDGTMPDDSAVSYASFSQKTVGLLVIGDEILKGYTVDQNTPAAAKAFLEANVYLRQVSVVSDDLEAICREIAQLSERVDVLVTSGGVGPTHDDVTIKSVARALDRELVLHTEMAELLKEKMKQDELTDAMIKMATLPKGSKLRYLSEDPNAWPVLQCRNIFVLPGVPEFFEAKIANVAKYLSCQLGRGNAYKVVLSVDENSIVPILNQVVENHPSVSIGSYPFVNHPETKTVITLEGKLRMDTKRNSIVLECDGPSEDRDSQVDAALGELMERLPTGSVLRVDNEDMALL